MSKAAIVSSPSGVNGYREKAISLNNLGCEFKRNGQFLKAISHLKEAVAIENLIGSAASNPSGTHLNLCSIYSEMGDHKTAVSHAKQALQILCLNKELNQLLEQVQSDPTIRIPIDSSGGGLVQVLSVTYHNLAVEQEFLHRHSPCYFLL
ncbi:hypothetical protein GEMRC1_010346 [Eukaryota sp. GEM-RC1]